jgi:hypothetical protein
MVSIRLNPTVFNSGGVFYGTPENRAVLTINTGRWESFAGKMPGGYPVTHESYRGGQYILMIDRTGTQIDDHAFEAMARTNESSISYYGIQIVNFMQRGLIIVERDGAALTVAQVKAFTA